MAATPPPALTIRRGEFAVAADIMTEAANWLIERGEPLWSTEQVAESALRARCPAESVVVGYDGEEAVVACVLEWVDTTFWPGVTDGAFIHRLAVRRNAAGAGYARALLDWAAFEAAGAGRTTLRLDCLADRPRLRAFYERCGFECVGFWVLGSRRNALYLRPVGSAG